MKKKLFVVSDVHGHCTLLKQALAEAGFDKENPDHLLICCGDYFDRGEENVEVLKFFEQQKHCVLLRGNHEDLLLKLLDTGMILPHNYINGTIQTLQDFFGTRAIDPTTSTVDFTGKTRTVDRLCEFIDSTLDYFETEHYVFVHGWIPCDAYADATPEQWEEARWIKWSTQYTGEPPIPGKTLVCGHYPAFFAKFIDPSRPPHCSNIFHGNGLYAIDAGTFDSQQVNVLVLEDTL